MQTNNVFRGKYWVRITIPTGEAVLTYKVNTQPNETIANALPICETAKVKSIVVDSIGNVTINVHHYDY